MNRRILGIVLAAVLGIGGTVLLVRYVQSARADAAEPEPTATVLVVQSDVAQGATLADVEAAVAPTEIPEQLLVEGALDDLDGVDPELIAAVDLESGEQLLRSRLVRPAELVSVDVPEGLQELTVALDPERAVGGRVESGSTVGVVLSFEPFDITTSGTPVEAAAATPETTTPKRTPNTTHLTLNDVLVTSVQLSRDDAEYTSESRDEGDDDETAVAADVGQAPDDQLLVTLAVTAPEAEQIVFASEFGRVWLTGQNGATVDDGSRIVTLEQVYVGVPRPGAPR